MMSSFGDCRKIINDTIIAVNGKMLATNGKFFKSPNLNKHNSKSLTDGNIGKGFCRFTE